MTDEDVITEILSAYQGRRSELIQILQAVQDTIGYLPEKVLLEVARLVRVPESHVYSVGTFYAQFRTLPLGRRRIAVCRGTACHIRGAPQILRTIEETINLKEGETSDDLEFTLETVACIGCCALAPCVRINREVAGNMTPERVRTMLRRSGKNGRRRRT